MEIQTLKTQTMSLRWFQFGNADGQPLVIIPGAAIKSVMESADLIAAQYSAFADRYNVYVIDRRSDIPEKYSVTDMAADTAAALDALGLKNADLFGVSQGGMIAQIIAADRPELVRRLVLCSTAPYFTPTAMQVLGKWSRLAAERDVDGLMQAFAEYVYSPAYCEAARDAFAAYGKTVTDEELRRFAISVSSAEPFDVRDKLKAIRCPVLVLGAEQDRIFGTEPSRDIVERTGGTLYIYPDAAHAVYDENPDVLVRMKAFLDKA